MAFDGNGFDIDIVNCNVTLICKLADQHALKENVPTLIKYKESPDKFRNFLAEYYVVAKEEAKLEIIKALYHGMPRDDNPILWRIVSEVHAFTEKILEKEEFSYLNAHFGDRNNPSATRLSYALGKVEEAFFFGGNP